MRSAAVTPVGTSARGVAGEPLVRFERVSCGYDGPPVLRDVDLAIRRGAFITSRSRPSTR